MEIKALIVDDERPARRRLLSLLSELPEVKVIGEAESGAEAVTIIDRQRPDIVLLDVQMPAMNGFDVLERISHVPEIIFVTAWDRYAIRAFEVNAVDYLLKPYSRERLLQSISKAVRSLRESVDKRAEIMSVLKRYRETDLRITRVSARSGTRVTLIDVAGCEFFRAEEGLVFVHTSGKRLLVDETLKTLAERLDPETFCRIHRNTIVNLSSVRDVLPLPNGRYEIVTRAGARLSVSRERAGEFRSAAGIGAHRKKRRAV